MVTVPLVNVKVPPTVTLPPRVTPLELLMVRLLYRMLPDTSGERAVTVCALVPL